MIESKNSFLAKFLFFINTPDAFVVTIEAPWCFTPLQLTQLCVATTVTITPLLFEQILSTAEHGYQEREIKEELGIIPESPEWKKERRVKKKQKSQWL